MGEKSGQKHLDKIAHILFLFLFYFGIFLFIFLFLFTRHEFSFLINLGGCFFWGGG